jgi:hypothetical protein
MDYDHFFAQGLFLFGGGRFPKSNKYVDSSLYGNHGTLTNMDAATDWVWDSTLGRWVMAFDGSIAPCERTLRCAKAPEEPPLTVTPPAGSTMVPLAASRPPRSA